MPEPTVSSRVAPYPQLLSCFEEDGMLLHALAALHPMDWARLCIASQPIRAKLLHRWQSKHLMVNDGSLVLVKRQDWNGLAFAIVYGNDTEDELCHVRYFDDFKRGAVPIGHVHAPPRYGLFAGLVAQWVADTVDLLGEKRRQILCTCCRGYSPRNDFCLAVAATLEQARSYAGRKADLFALLEYSVRQRDWELVGLWTHLGGDIFGKTAAGGSLLVIATYNGDFKQLQRVVNELHHKCK